MSASTSRGFIYLSGSLIIFSLAGYLTNVWIGRELGPSIYGVYGVLTSMMAAINVIQISGVPQAVSRFVAEDNNKAPSIFYSGLKIQFFSGILIGLIFASAAPLMASLFKTPNLLRYEVLMSLIFPFYGLFGLLNGYYNGLHRFKRQAVMYVAYSIAKLVFVIGLAMIYGLYGAIIGFILAPIFGAAAGIVRPKSVSEYPVRKLLMYSIPLVGFAALSTLQLSIDLFSVKVFIANPAVSGLYVAAQNILLIIYLGLGPLGQVAFPAIANFIKRGQRLEAASLVTSSLRWLLLLLLPLLALIVSTAPELINFLYGPRYIGAVILVRLLAPGYLGLVIFSLFANVLNGAGYAKKTIFVAMIGLLTALAGCIVLIPSFGASGAAASTDMGGLVVAVISAVLAHRLLEYRWNIVSIFRCSLGAIIIGTIGFLMVSVPSIWTPILWIALLFVYICWLLLTSELNADDRSAIRRLIPLLRASKRVQS